MGTSIPWREVIQKELGLNCEIENDVNCAALLKYYNITQYYPLKTFIHTKN